MSDAAKPAAGTAGQGGISLNNFLDVLMVEKVLLALFAAAIELLTNIDSGVAIDATPGEVLIRFLAESTSTMPPAAKSIFDKLPTLKVLFVASMKLATIDGTNTVPPPDLSDG